jgi:hypothetical protein
MTITPDRFEYVTPNDVYARLAGGGSVSIEEWPDGDLCALAERLRQRSGVVIVVPGEDSGNPMDLVTIHPDEGARLALIDDALRALGNARAALTHTGHVDRP